jgi:nucleoside-diphosphate-sugar epimerase
MGHWIARREFLAVDDLADACVFVMQRYSDLQFLNIGTGEDITIADFARLVAEVVGFSGKIEFDVSRPDGAPRKLLDVSRINALGWRAHAAASRIAANVRGLHRALSRNAERSQNKPAVQQRRLGILNDGDHAQ